MQKQVTPFLHVVAQGHSSMYTGMRAPARGSMGALQVLKQVCLHCQIAVLGHNGCATR